MWDSGQNKLQLLLSVITFTLLEQHTLIKLCHIRKRITQLGTNVNYKY